MRTFFLWVYLLGDEENAERSGSAVGRNDGAGCRLQDLVKSAKAFKIFSHLFDYLYVAAGMSDEYAVRGSALKISFHIPDIIHDKAGVMPPVFFLRMHRAISDRNARMKLKNRAKKG